MTSFLIVFTIFIIVFYLLRKNKNTYYNQENKVSLEFVDFFLDLIFSIFLGLFGLGVYQFFSLLQD